MIKIFANSYIRTVSLLIMLFLPITSAFAGRDAGQAANRADGLTNPINADSIPELLRFIIIDLLINRVAPVVVTVALVYSGFLFVQAQGNPSKLQKAKAALLWTIVGAVLLIGASVIFSIVTSTVAELGVGS